ncbi:hypothetical protein CDV31_011906 [Fusarium ambrosium]|uniref:Cell wall protein PhiA n=1 Tax=Fusarium ambrosium TaxID=131363 RepID=A0A428TDS1_9HYPO|nr:hypothetical protein CDV31_011906 [Fusarium ambrosium]
MMFKNLLLASLSGLAAAAPADTKIVSNPSFQVISLRSASDIHFSKVTAANSSLFLGLADQGASCDRGEKPDAATFYLKSGELFLYKTDNPPQQIYADRSGMAKAVLATSPALSHPLIDGDGNLTLEGASLRACLGANDAWVVWVSAGSANPNGYDECLGFTARTGNIEDPVSCLYTQQS